MSAVSQTTVSEAFSWMKTYVFQLKIHYNMWDEITYPFLNFNGATVEV